MDFEWDPDKNEENIEKHHVSFEDARRAWLDPDRVVAKDKRYSRIIGAGYWREGRNRYEELNTFRK